MTQTLQLIDVSHDYGSGDLRVLALDTVTGESIVHLIRDRVNAGAAAIVATHEPRLAAWADRVFTLEDGRLYATEQAQR